MTHARLRQQVVPALLVRDMKETLSFYKRLGFRVTGRFPDDANPVWSEVARDAVVIQFHTEPSVGTPETPIFSGTLYFYPESVSSLVDEFRGKVDFAWGPEVMSYGMREFAVQDPNGYFLAFTEPA